MSKSITSLKWSFDKAMTQFIWDQWCVVGGSGSNQKKPIPFAVDIEALILATSRFGASDPRTMDVCFDWLALNGKLVNLQRLKNIQNIGNFGDPAILVSIADSMIRDGHHNWKSLIKAFSPDPGAVEETPQLYRSRTLSRQPPASSPECFLLRMRSLFGVNARVEVFTWLLTHERGHAAEIARECFWLPKTVQVTLHELCTGEFVSPYPVAREKREKVFYIANPEEWEKVLYTRSEVQWIAQPPVYSACWKLLQVLGTLLDMEGSSPKIQGIHLRREISEIAIALEDAKLSSFFSTWQNYGDGESLLTWFLERTSMFSSVVLRDRVFSA